MTIKVVEGKDGMLFLDNDSNRVMQQITGEMKPGARALAVLHRPHAERRALCERLGIAYRHVICPNKESVEIERLPDRYRYEAEGPTFLAQYLAAFPQEPPFYDRQILRGIDGAYVRTDSHWTDLGALAYLRAALRAYGDTRVLGRLEAVGPQAHELERVGDLGKQLGSPAERHPALRLTVRSSQLVFQATASNEGYVRLDRSMAPDNAGHRALVLHDSFTWALYRFLAESYEETLFIHTPDLDQRFLERYRPTMLWFFQAERFLPREIRNDVDFASFVAACERRKGKPPEGSRFLADLAPRSAALPKAPANG